MISMANLASEKRQLTEEQETVVLELHDRALRMTALAFNALIADTTNDYTNAMAVVMPLLGYAFGIAAKMALALDHLQRTGTMPSPARPHETGDLSRACWSFLNPYLPSDIRVRPGFKGHTVAITIDNVAGQLQVPGAAALRELADMPLYRNCLDAVTMFYGITRYALLDELLNPDDERLHLGRQLPATRLPGPGTKTPTKRRPELDSPTHPVWGVSLIANTCPRWALRTGTCSSPCRRSLPRNSPTSTTPNAARTDSSMG